MARVRLFLLFLLLVSGTVGWAAGCAEPTVQPGGVLVVAPQKLDPAVERLATLPIKEMVTTDTLPIAPERMLPNMSVLSVSGLLGEVIMRSHEGRSVGELFNE